MLPIWMIFMELPKLSSTLPTKRWMKAVALSNFGLINYGRASFKDALFFITTYPNEF